MSQLSDVVEAMTAEQRIDPRAVEPFNAWWRRFARQASPPSNPELVAAFGAGFKAGMEYAVAKACAIISGEKP